MVIHPGTQYPVLISVNWTGRRQTSNLVLFKSCECSVSEPIEKQKNFVSISYFSVQSYRLTKELFLLFFKFAPCYDFVVVQVNCHKIGSLFNYQDRLPTWLRHYMVCLTEYVDSPSHIFHVRTSEHGGKSHRTGSLLMSAPSLSNVRLHALNSRVSITDSDFKILSSCEHSCETFNSWINVYSETET